MKTKYLIGFIALLVLLIAIILGLKTFNKTRTEMAGNQVDIIINSAELFQNYSKNETEANKIYLNKILKVNGVVGEISKNPAGELNLILLVEDELSGISCTMSKNQSATEIKPNQKISIKGRCTGMLTDVILIDCIVDK